MKRAVVLVVLVAGVAAVGLPGIGAVLRDRLVSLTLPHSMFPYECTHDDKRLASSLVTLGLLDAHPAGAQSYGKRGGGCDDDDRLAYANQSYRLSGSLGRVLPFYRTAAVKDGWRPVPVPEPERESEEVIEQICITKVVNDRNVYISVWYPKRLENDGGPYSLDVVSGPSGGNLC